MQPVHDRMPVIIAKPDYGLWLDKQQAQDKLEPLLSADTYREMQIYPISSWVNNPRHNDKNCLL